MAYINGQRVLLTSNLTTATMPIDQTYSPTSENAQSGKAVAEAISTVTNEGSGTWEKLVDFLMTEEVNSVILTNEEYPKIAKCKEFIMRVVFAKKSTDTSLGTMSIRLNGSSIFRAGNVTVNANYFTETRCHTIVADGLVHTVGTENNRGHNNIVGNAIIFVGNIFVDAPQKIEFVLNETAKYFPLGTQIVLYGKAG